MATSKWIGLFLLCILLVGCSDNNNANNIKPEENSSIQIRFLDFDDEEYSIMKATGVSNSMIFVIDPNDEVINSTEYWVDRYVDGVFKETFLNTKSSALQNDKVFKIYFSSLDIDSKEVWTMALRQNGNITSGRVVLEKIVYDSTITHPIDSISINTGEIVDLGVIIRNQGNSSGTIHDVINTIKENKEVFVVRCKIY